MIVQISTDQCTQNIDFTTSVDSVGWRKMPISEKVILYMKKGQNSSSWQGDSWRGELLSDAPVGFDSSHTFYGAAGGIGGDHALNVCGRITDGGKVEIQTQNLYAGTVTSSIFWWAYIIEILG